MPIICNFLIKNMEEVIQEAETEEVPEKETKQRVKNLISVAILLGGLFVGSLFVDIIQLVSGSGFSSKKIQESGVLAMGGRTWVAYDQPVVKVRVFSSANCSTCKTDEVLVWLRRLLPTIQAEKIDTDTAEGKASAAKLGVKTIPGFVFSEEVVQSDFFAKAPNVFAQKEKEYVMNGSEIGMPVGQYLELPVVDEQNAKIGKDDAPIRLIEFSDFQCPYCKTLHESVKQVLAENGDQVQLVFKNLPLDFHAQAPGAALAGACADEQGKFEVFADKLFANQSDWSATKGTAKFKTYALQLGLKTADFNKCLDDKKYQELIDKDKAEAEKFGITGTPAIFINGQFKNGAVSLEELRTIIDEELGK